MGAFSAQWLALREPLDAAARPAALGAALTRVLAARRPPGARLDVIDLATGTGANLRYAAPLLGGSQDWLLIDSDAPLLRCAAERLREWGRQGGADVGECGRRLSIRAGRFDCSIDRGQLDLATQLDELVLPAGALLTAAALLDLVSQSWLTALARRAAAAAVTVWFALTYDGRMQCHPAEPQDEEVRELVNAHQRRDKGFGAALGPAAAAAAQQSFAQQGYDIRCARSDWKIGAAHAPLQRALIEGWAQAGCEMAPARSTALHAWLRRRRQHIDGGRCELVVGHTDVIGWPHRALRGFAAAPERLDFEQPDPSR